MNHSRRRHLIILAGAISLPRLHGVSQESDFAIYSDAHKESVLLKAKIVSVEEIGHGVTKPLQAKLEWAGKHHSAKIQTVDKDLPDFFPSDGSRPVPMKDSWRFNIAAYKLDRLLGLNMVTVAVARPFRGKPAAFSWWVDGVQFEEVDRIKRGLTPPDPEEFERQRAQSRVFDELIINIDRNLSNLLITKDWKIALIDHSRSFTPYPGIRNEKNLTKISRTLLARLKTLTSASLTRTVGNHLTRNEARAVIGRRDRIVEYFERRVRETGEGNVLFP